VGDLDAEGPAVDESDAHGFAEKEWEQCRATIGRLDQRIADYWKYGFTFLTRLISATALVGHQLKDTKPDNWPEIAASAVIVLAFLTT
jgi:hypothetical protein